MVHSIRYPDHRPDYRWSLYGRRAYPGIQRVAPNIRCTYFSVPETDELAVIATQVRPLLLQNIRRCRERLAEIRDHYQVFTLAHLQAADRIILTINLGSQLSSGFSVPQHLPPD